MPEAGGTGKSAGFRRKRGPAQGQGGNARQAAGAGWGAQRAAGRPNSRYSWRRISGQAEGKGHRRPGAPNKSQSHLGASHRLFNPLEEEISCKRVDTDGMLIDIAHLIDSKHIEKYQNRYSSAAKQLKNCEISVSGPWPPYHFLPGKLRTVA